MEHTATTEVAIKLAKVAKLLRDYHGNNPLKELKEAFSLLDDPDVIRYIKLITTPQSAS